MSHPSLRDTSRAESADALDRVPECKRDLQLRALAGLASVDIETSIARDLSGSLHTLFDHVCDKALPIYFGPLLGRLYLEGL